ncbi:MAG: 1-acyl-sn-glycerol-3-phosphate acyltransferase, partial [Bacteroidota bacterium]
MGKKKSIYREILPNKSDWPIVRLSDSKTTFLSKVKESATQNLHEKRRGSLRKEIETAIHREQVRMKTNPWRVDPPSDTVFWKKIQGQLAALDPDDPLLEEKEEQIFDEILDKYLLEISGTFKKTSYRLARSVITFGFARLLNAARVKGLLSLFSKELDLDDKINVVGETMQLRELAKKGIVVMVPTHFSNIDSILIGWVIQHLGLPAFMYGAGLNLFNIKAIAYFMNSLGAYKVDRRKKNPIYLETLKTYSRLAIEEGCHSLFFPRGSRSRSGALETSLKTGLLSTTIEAQRELYQKAEKGETVKKVFIVPVVLNYHFTLEAPTLIRDHLQKTGKERYYVEADEFSTSYKIGTFLLKFFTKGSNVSVNIGRGLDILGNPVDADGNSFDKNGHPIDTRDYFLRNKEITIDSQRELEYVRVLSQRIVDEYHRYNRVFASHLVAFIAFKILERQNPDLDVFSILRLPDEDLVFDYQLLEDHFKQLKKRLLRLQKRGKIQLAAHMYKKASKAIAHGLENLGLYHDQRPLIRKADQIIIQDPNTLYYYHNRMS